MYCVTAADFCEICDLGPLDYGAGVSIVEHVERRARRLCSTHCAAVLMSRDTGLTYNGGTDQTPVGANTEAAVVVTNEAAERMNQ